MIAWCLRKDVTWPCPVYRGVAECRCPRGAVVRRQQQQGVSPTLGPEGGKHRVSPPACPSGELMSSKERCFGGRMFAAKIKPGLC